MSIHFLNPTQFKAWVEGLIPSRTIVAPQVQGDRFAFAPLHRADDLRLDYDVTLLPPKKYFQPPVEQLLSFKGHDCTSHLNEHEPFVLFGVHPYDVVAILQMDTVFSSGEYDAHYMARRERATLVAVDVQNASPNVFAGCMDTAVVTEGFDVLLTRLDGGWVVEAQGDKGAALLRSMPDAPAADEATLKMREMVWERNRKLLRRHELKPAPGDLPELLGRSYEHPVWEEKSRLCFSCGSCNLVCPTCYCFDVQDRLTWDLSQGTRIRTWDGCMLMDFAKVAGGHNFRATREGRYRHRLYRKGKYLWDQHRQIACVGCGRCVGVCVPNIANPVEVYNRLAEDSTT